MDDLVGREFGPYRIVATLGEGGMASVYKAYQPAVDRHVAIKVLPRQLAADPEYLARFRHEARIVARLQHPNILPVFDFGEADGYTFLAMPLIEGGTLAQSCHGNIMAPAAAEHLISQICDALTYAHAKGIVHRDLKPSNILIDESGNCLVADFGIAHLAGDATKLTVTGSVIGTPGPMSPEQALGGDIGPWSDIYSVGIILYELLTGRVPFKADTPIAVALKHVTAPLPPPRTFNPALSEDVETVLLKALARSKDDRYTSAHDLSTALAGAVTASAPTTQARIIAADAPTIRLPHDEPASHASTHLPTAPPYAPPTDPPEAPRGRWTYRALVAAILILIAGAGVYLRTTRRPPVAPPAAVAAESSASSPTATSTPATPSAPEPPLEPSAAPTSTSAPASQPPQPRPVEAVAPARSRSDAPARPAVVATKAAPAGNDDAAVATVLPANLAPSDYAQAVAQYKRFCDAGKLVSCANLGVMYMDGHGVPRDEKRAVELFQRACDGRNPLGCAHLGTMYLSGRGVAKDETRATTLLREACNAGNTLGCTRLHALTNRN